MSPPLPTGVLIAALILLAGTMTLGAGLMAEMRRKRMTPQVQSRAPGRMVALRRGKTHVMWDGPADGRVVICVHGLSTPSQVFEPLVKRLTAEGWRVLRYDLPGRGFSDRVRGPQSLRFFLSQLAEVMEAEGIAGPVPLIGYSMGGAIVTRFAATWPERTAGIALLAPAGFRHGLKGLYAVCARVPLFGDALWSLLAGRMLRRTGPVGELPALPAMMARETAMRGYLPALLSSVRHTLGYPLDASHAVLARGGTPVLAIWGGSDAVIPPAGRARLAAANPAAEQTTLKGAGHGLPFTHPDQVADALLSWLARP